MHGRTSSCWRSCAFFQTWQFAGCGCRSGRVAGRPGGDVLARPPRARAARVGRPGPDRHRPCCSVPASGGARVLRRQAGLSAGSSALARRACSIILGSPRPRRHCGGRIDDPATPRPLGLGMLVGRIGMVAPAIRVPKRRAERLFPDGRALDPCRWTAPSRMTWRSASL